MQVGDLVDDGFDNIGFIVELGWFELGSANKTRAYLVHFSGDTTQNGWYGIHDLEAV